MIDLVDQAQVLLRDAGYVTSPAEGSHDALHFEDDVVFGLLYVFRDVPALLSGWSAAQKSGILRLAPQLRMSREKAWNIYTVFLTSSDAKPEQAYEIDRIEEDLSSARKIARAGVKSAADLRRALLPLLPIRSSGDVSTSDYVAKIKSRLSMLPASAVEAILNSTDIKDIVRILMERT
jgi:hypothetical protein